MYRVSDLKQYVYCPRVIFFNYVQKVPRKTSFKMEDGKTEHKRTTSLEERRSLRAFGLDEGERFYQVSLFSHRLRLSGTLDMLIKSRLRGYVPVDFKDSLRPPGLNHKYQLVAYSMLVEEKYETTVREAYIYQIPNKRAHRFMITQNGRDFVRRIVDKMDRIVAQEFMPDGTRRRGRCRDCEYRRYCGED